MTIFIAIEQMIQFYVALFGEFTSAVPETWLDEDHKHVFWPPTKGPLNKEKMETLMPNKNWTKYNNKRVLGPYDYEKAKKMENETTTISTEEDIDAINEEIESTQNSLKRKHVQNTRYSDYVHSFRSPSDSSDESNTTRYEEKMPKKSLNHKQLALPNPPKLAKNIKNENINRDKRTTCDQSEMKEVKVIINKRVGNSAFDGKKVLLLKPCSESLLKDPLPEDDMTNYGDGEEEHFQEDNSEREEVEVPDERPSMDYALHNEPVYDEMIDGDLSSNNIDGDLSTNKAKPTKVKIISNNLHKPSPTSSIKKVIPPSTIPKKKIVKIQTTEENHIERTTPNTSRAKKRIW